MILELKGTKVTIVDKTLGYQGDNLVDTIQVTVDKDSTWNYKLDMYKGKSKCFDSVLMVREGNICTVQLTNEILSYGGRYVFQLRGYTDTQTYHSDIFESWVNASIEYQYDCKQTDCGCDCKLPTEFYQVEDNVTEINNHPPYPGDNNKWMIWDVNKHEYVESDIEVIGGGEDYQTKDNLTTSITAESTDEQYPSAKATYDAIQNASVVTVKITGSGTDSDPYVSSMTYDEIKSHMQAGKTVVAVGGEMSGNGFYVASHIWTTRIDFARMVNVNYNNVMSRFCSVYTDGRVDYTGFDLETTLHKVTSLSADSTNAKYPSAKAVYDAIQAAKPDIVTPTAESTDTQAASAKAVWDMLGTGGSGTDISLGVTGASVGDIIKVKAVDDSGKPTEWETAGYTLLSESTGISEAVAMFEFTGLIGYNDFVLVANMPKASGSAKYILYINNRQVSGSLGNYFLHPNSPKNVILGVACNLIDKHYATYGASQTQNRSNNQDNFGVNFGQTLLSDNESIESLKIASDNSDVLIPAQTSYKFYGRYINA